MDDLNVQSSQYKQYFKGALRRDSPDAFNLVKVYYHIRKLAMRFASNESSTSTLSWVGDFYKMNSIFATAKAEDTSPVLKSTILTCLADALQHLYTQNQFKGNAGLRRGYKNIAQFLVDNKEAALEVVNQVSIDNAEQSLEQYKAVQNEIREDDQRFSEMLEAFGEEREKEREKLQYLNQTTRVKRELLQQQVHKLEERARVMTQVTRAMHAMLTLLCASTMPYNQELSIGLTTLLIHLSNIATLSISLHKDGCPDGFLNKTPLYTISSSIIVALSAAELLTSEKKTLISLGIGLSLISSILSSSALVDEVQKEYSL